LPPSEKKSAKEEREKLRSYFSTSVNDQKSQMLLKDEKSERRETAKLAKCLSDQILLDQKLAYSKFVFSDWRDVNKWNLLL
jgi:hypothetical protein